MALAIIISQPIHRPIGWFQSKTNMRSMMGNDQARVSPTALQLPVVEIEFAKNLFWDEFYC
jgi:hypothetical protein